MLIKNLCKLLRLCTSQSFDRLFAQFWRQMARSILILEPCMQLIRLIRYCHLVLITKFGAFARHAGATSEHHVGRVAVGFHNGVFCSTNLPVTIYSRRNRSYFLNYVWIFMPPSLMGNLVHPSTSHAWRFHTLRKKSLKRFWELRIAFSIPSSASSKGIRSPYLHIKYLKNKRTKEFPTFGLVQETNRWCNPQRPSAH